MNKNERASAPWALVAVAAAAFGAAALLAGCGTTTLSKRVTSEGTAAEIVFPDSARASTKGGTLLKVYHLRQVGPGVTKAQLYDLLGPPHFAEGIGAVREWDYLFQFRAAPGESVTTCQYKVLFDKGMLARSFHWKTANCAALLSKRWVVARAPMPSL